MKNYKDDPRITAYVLNELDEKERIQFEKEMQDNTELQSEVADIRNTTLLLADNLKQEPMPALSNVQKEEILVGKKKKRAWFKRPAFKISFSLGAFTAAVLAVILMFGPFSSYLGIRSKPIRDLGVNEIIEETYDIASQESLPMEMRKMAAMPAGYAASTISGGMVEGDDEALSRERYDRIYENEFILTSQDPRSTFSIDVDTASYSNVRRFLNDGVLPPKDSVRIEELVNYFTYDYPNAKEGEPFSVNMEVAQSPWHKEYKLVRIAVKARDIDWNKRPKTNLVFLLDVSGSMNDQNKLPLLVRSMKMLTDNLGDNDKVSIVVYAGASGLVLDSTKGSDKAKIKEALDKLNAGGSTNGGQGIELAYKLAEKNFIKAGVNRVILATDGDFNVGTTSEGDLTRLIEEKAKSGVFLTVLGFGMGNYNDSTMEKLADKGNGNYAYIDNFQESRKVLSEQLAGTMLTIAKDVKMQIEFNPLKVQAHRLVGYENRVLAHQDFKDDKKDAGDIGAGHTVTVLYEIVPKGAKVDVPDVDPLKYQKTETDYDSNSDELLTLKVRFKKPDGDTSKLLEFPLKDADTEFKDASKDFKFATAVATFGMLLRDSKQKGDITYDDIIEIARQGKGEDLRGYKGEFIRLVEMAKSMK